MSNLNIKGLDVSNYQGNVDFQAVKNAGYEVVIIETSDGITFTCPTLVEQYNAAVAAGLKIGFYHFFRAEDDNTQQTQHFWNLIKDKHYDVYPVLDVEVTMNVANVTDAVLDFIEKFKQLSGQECIIYTYTGFCGNLDSRLSKYKSWMANYGLNSLPPDNIWGNNHVGWQYTSNGKIAGLSNNFDLDHFSDQIYISTPPAPPPTNLPAPNSGPPVGSVVVPGASDYTVAVNTIPPMVQPSAPIPKQPAPTPAPAEYYQNNYHGKLVVQLQKGLGMSPITGIFDEATLNAVNSDNLNNESTAALQRILIMQGYSIPNSEIGGIGMNTLNAIQAVQQKNGLNANGLLSSDTWSAIMKAPTP